MYQYVLHIISSCIATSLILFCERKKDVFVHLLCVCVDYIRKKILIQQKQGNYGNTKQLKVLNKQNPSGGMHAPKNLLQLQVLDLNFCGFYSHSYFTYVSFFISSFFAFFSTTEQGPNPAALLPSFMIHSLYRIELNKNFHNLNNAYKGAKKLLREAV